MALCPDQVHKAEALLKATPAFHHTTLLLSTGTKVAVLLTLTSWGGEDEGVGPGGPDL